MGDFWFPKSASTMAPKIDSLFSFVNVVSTILLVGVVAAMLWFVYRYRRQDPGERPAPVQESRALEISWIVIPTILVLLVFNWGFKTFVRQKTIPPNAYQIRVTAQQWNWLFRYPNGVTTSDTLYVPVGEPVKTKMSSKDVIHSFFVPAFRVKQDVLPNRYTSVWFEATKKGTYDLFCAEYCGLNHSEMDATVKVVSRQRFNQWLENAATPKDIPLPQLGKRLYKQRNCWTCHSLDGSRKVGPTFKGLYGSTETLSDGSTVTVDENYLRQSILKPQSRIVKGYPQVMPSTYAGLSERQLSALIEFIKAQSDKKPPKGDVPEKNTTSQGA